MITHGLPHWLQKELDVLDTLSEECEVESLALSNSYWPFVLAALINGHIAVEQAQGEMK